MSPNFILDSLNQRRTSKVIGNVDSPEVPTNQNDEMAETLLKAAGNAPFHVPCDRSHQSDQRSIVPWRAYALNAQTCRQLMTKMIASGDTTKIPAMLAAAEYLFQVTWLPDPATSESETQENQLFEPTMRNMEHIASASAFAQSLLLAGESQGFKTYWSSGGVLRSEQTFEWLGISPSEVLIGSIFLFSAEPENAEIKPGSHANNRGDLTDWCSWPRLD